MLEACRGCAVDPALDGQVAKIQADCDARPDRRERVEALRPGVLPLPLLHLARRHVVHTRDAEDVRCARLVAHPLRAPADHDAGLRFVSPRGPTPGGMLIASPGPITAVDGLMKMSGSAGSGFPCSAACARSSGRPRRSSTADGREQPGALEPVGRPQPLLPVAEDVADQLPHLAVPLDDVLGPAPALIRSRARHQRAVSSTRLDCCETLRAAAVSTATTAYTYRTPRFTLTSRYVVSLIGCL